jgi:hypothetical protein
VLKKAGIVVAAAAAGLLALSPLAFAHDGNNGGSPQTPPTTVVVEEGDTTSRSPECTFDAAADNSVDQEGVGGGSLLGLGGLVANTAAPVNAQTQAPILSCNNIEDILSTETTDNSEDNDVDRTDVEDSFNTED